MNIKHKKAPPRDKIGPRVGYLSKLINRAFNSVIAEEGLFSGQQEILFLLNNTPGITVGELAKQTGVAPATACVSVKRMEKSGFITKKPDETDARIIRLYPTEKAKKAPSNIHKKMDALEQIITKNMTPEQVLMLSDLLQGAIDNLEKEEC